LGLLGPYLIYLLAQNSVANEFLLQDWHFHALKRKLKLHHFGVLVALVVKLTLGAISILLEHEALEHGLEVANVARDVPLGDLSKRTVVNQIFGVFHGNISDIIGQLTIEIGFEIGSDILDQSQDRSEESK